MALMPPPTRAPSAVPGMQTPTAETFFCKHEFWLRKKLISTVHVSVPTRNYFPIKQNSVTTAADGSEEVERFHQVQL